MITSKQIVSVSFLVLVLVTFVLFSLRKINHLVFWIIMGCGAMVAYVVLPMLEEKKR